VLDGISKGNIIATVDQQPYSQGYFAIEQLALDIRYGLYPSDMKTGGLGLVDNGNYKPAVEFAGKYR
jgi:simple sugar transport system substrate-binding protein